MERKFNQVQEDVLSRIEAEADRADSGEYGRRIMPGEIQIETPWPKGGMGSKR